MDIFELKARFPKTYQQVFDAGVRAERAKHLGADLIACAEPRGTYPAIFDLGYNKTAPGAKPARSVRSPWIVAP
jgi:hypothetical protein